jgi:hypothetical protein
MLVHSLIIAIALKHLLRPSDVLAAIQVTKDSASLLLVMWTVGEDQETVQNTCGARSEL